MELRENRTRLLAMISIIGCLAFLLLTVLAMAVYTGGTHRNHAQPHYLFYENPFSDLGRTRGFHGRSNLTCMGLFITAMLSGGVALASFFTAFAQAACGTKGSRFLSNIGALLGIGAALSFIGVACTPWDLFRWLHMQFVFMAFRLLLLASIFNLIAIPMCKSLKRRLMVPFAVFICLLIAYIALLTAGVPGSRWSNPILQATGQKVIVYSAIIMVLVQAGALRRIR